MCPMNPLIIYFSSPHAASRTIMDFINIVKLLHKSLVMSFFKDFFFQYQSIISVFLFVSLQHYRPLDSASHHYQHCHYLVVTTTCLVHRVTSAPCAAVMWVQPSSDPLTRRWRRLWMRPTLWHSTWKTKTNSRV